MVISLVYYYRLLVADLSTLETLLRLLQLR